MSATKYISMEHYYVYELIDPRDHKVFYVGKGTGDRAYQHQKFQDGNRNPHKDRKIKKILATGKEIVVNIVKKNLNEERAYKLESKIIKKIGIDNLTNICEDRIPPSRKGWHPSAKTLAKRSAKLKGIPRTDIWCERLSKSKQGKNNPRWGFKESKESIQKRRLSQIITKNKPNYDLYKNAIEKMNEGSSAGYVSRELRIGRGVCFRLKNKTHMIYEAFPELLNCW